MRKCSIECQFVSHLCVVPACHHCPALDEFDWHYQASAVHCSKSIILGNIDNFSSENQISQKNFRECLELNPGQLDSEARLLTSIHWYSSVVEHTPHYLEVVSFSRSSFPSAVQCPLRRWISTCDANAKIEISGYAAKCETGSTNTCGVVNAP